MEEDNEICGYLNSETNLCEAEPKVEVQSEAEIKKDIQDKVDDHEYIRTQFITAKAVRQSATRFAFDPWYYVNYKAYSDMIKGQVLFFWIWLMILIVMVILTIQ